MPVSTWNMMRWGAVMTSNLVSMISKVYKMFGVEGAHGMGKLKQPCLHLSMLGSRSGKALHGVPPPA